jgi:hypothetical protein
MTDELPSTPPAIHESGEVIAPVAAGQRAPVGGPTPEERKKWARGRVIGPSVALIVVACIGLLMQVFSLLLNNLFGLGAGDSDLPLEGMENMPEFLMPLYSGAFAMAANAVGIGVAVLVMVGAIRMLNLKSWGLALAASILVMVPMVSPCCTLGLPIGIWALVVMVNEDVKQAFE